MNKFGPKKWSTIAQHLPGRIGKQCRERCDGRAVNILNLITFGTLEKAKREGEFEPRNVTFLRMGNNSWAKPDNIGLMLLNFNNL